MDKSTVYLSINDQYDIKCKLETVTHRAPISEKIFYQNGYAVAGATLFACNTIYFRCGFRAFNLYRYNRNRLVTYVISSAFCVYGSMLHATFSSFTLNDYYRPENIWYHGKKSLLVHQVGTFLCLTFTIGSTYLNARLNGMVPVTDDFLRRHEPKWVPFKNAMARLKPYTRTIAVTWIISSAFMLWVGTQEYQQSCNLLAKLNRKTLSHKED